MIWQQFYNADIY